MSTRRLRQEAIFDATVEGREGLTNKHFNAARPLRLRTRRPIKISFTIGNLGFGGSGSTVIGFPGHVRPRWRCRWACIGDDLAVRVV